MSDSIYPKYAERLGHCTCYGSGEDFWQCVAEIERLWEMGQFSQDEYKLLNIQIKISKEAMVSKLKKDIASIELALQRTAQEWSLLQTHLKNLNFELTLLLPTKQLKS